MATAPTTTPDMKVCPEREPLSRRPLLTGRQAGELEALFKVLGNRHRVRLVHTLVKAGEMCVGDLAKAIDMQTQAVSNQLKHLAMLDVVEAVIGEIFLNDCVIRPESCQRTPACSAHQVWEKARDQLRNTLRQTSFKQMLEDESCRTDQLKTPR